MKIQNLLLILVIITAIFLRVMNFSADSIGDDFLSTEDEGLYSYSARSKVLFNSWQTDNFNYGRLMPLFPVLQALPVYVLGVHSYSFRLISFILSLATILLLLIFIKKTFNINSALIGISVLTFDYLFLLYSRSGLPEITMLFFALLAFICWYYALIHQKKYEFFALLSGIFLLCTFLIKLSVISIVGAFMCSLVLCLFQLKINKKQELIRILRIGIFFSLPFIIGGILYYFFCYISNPKEWYENYLATLNIHRLKRVYFSVPYLSEQAKNLINSDYWKYSGFFVITTLFAGILNFKKVKNSLKEFNKINLLFIMSAGWFIFFCVQAYITPAKLGRFLVMGIVPMSLIIASGFYFLSTKRKIIVLSILIIAFIINGYYSVQQVIIKPKFLYQSAITKLNKIVGPNDVTMLPPHWIMNASYKSINPFLIAHTDKDLNYFFQKYGRPSIVSLIDYQVDDFKLNAPQFYSTLAPITKINEYYIYRVNTL